MKGINNKTIAVKVTLNDEKVMTLNKTNGIARN